MMETKLGLWAGTDTPPDHDKTVSWKRVTELDLIMVNLRETKFDILSIPIGPLTDGSTGSDILDAIEHLLYEGSLFHMPGFIKVRGTIDGVVELQSYALELVSK